MNLKKHTLLSLVFTVLVLLCRFGSYTVSPLWLDYFKFVNKSKSSIWNGSEITDEIYQSQPFFIVFVQAAVPTIIWGGLFFCALLACPNSYGDMERNYPKMLLIAPGLSMSLTAIMINYSLSGTRTAPYLQAILGNFAVPMQFIVRFLILRKRPTLRKGLCVAVILLAEFVCLLPTIFPWLETSKQHAEDGGSTGAAAILWPLCFVLSQIPYTTTNALVESTVKDEYVAKEDTASAKQINMIFFLFWLEFSLLVGTTALFFVDIIPGFGTSRNMYIFWEKFKFNLLCSLGQSECGPEVAGLAWGSILLGNFFAMFAIAYLLRYSEGANYFIVIMTLRSPLLLLFWTLFDEHPFEWNPHVHLSTYLSIGALAIMIPAVILYNTGAPEKSVTHKQPVEEDEQALIKEEINPTGTRTEFNEI